MTYRETIEEENKSTSESLPIWNNWTTIVIMYMSNYK